MFIAIVDKFLITESADKNFYANYKNKIIFI